MMPTDKRGFPESFPTTLPADPPSLTLSGLCMMGARVPSKSSRKKTCGAPRILDPILRFNLSPRYSTAGRLCGERSALGGKTPEKARERPVAPAFFYEIDQERAGRDG